MPPPRPESQTKAREGVEAKPGTEWLKPGLMGRQRHPKGEDKLRHASLRELVP